MPVNNPYAKYRQQSVMTMTQDEMLQLLYEEVIKQLNAAILFIQEKDINRTNSALLKAQKILNHLNATLDSKYEISQSLSALYGFFVRQIVQANVKKDVKPIQEILPMIEDLKKTYEEAGRRVRMQKQ